MSCVLTGCTISAEGFGVLTVSVITDTTISENTIDSAASGVGVGGSGVNRLVIHDNIVEATEHGMVIGGNASFYEIHHNVVRTAGEIGIWLQGTQRGVVQGNVIEDSGEHGIYLDDVDDTIVSDNLITNPGISSPNSFDGIMIENDSDNNHVHHNKIMPDTGGPGDTRYGINIADSTCDCNVVVGNQLGDSTFYGTAPLNDAGTGTWLVYPNDPTVGDNFVDCATSP